MRLVFARDLSLDTTYKRTHIPNADKPEPYIRTQMASCTEAAAAGALLRCERRAMCPRKTRAMRSRGARDCGCVRLFARYIVPFDTVRFIPGARTKMHTRRACLRYCPPHHRSNCAARVSFLHCQFSPIAGADERHCATSTRMIHFLIVDKIHQDVCVCVGDDESARRPQRSAMPLEAHSQFADDCDGWWWFLYAMMMMFTNSIMRK